MRKLRLVIALAITLILTFQVAYCDTPTGGASQKLTLSLDEALALLDKNNAEIILMDRKVDIAQKQHDNALEAANAAKGKYSSSTSANLQYRKQEGLNWKLTLQELNNAKNDKAELVKSLHYSLKQQYFEILLLQNDLGILKDELNSLDKKITEVQLRIKLGQAKDTDYKSLLSQKLTMQNQYNSVNKQINTALLNMKKDLGIPISTEISLKEAVLPSIALDSENLADKIRKAVDNLYEITNQQKTIELKKLERQLVMDYSDYKYSTTYFDLNTTISELEADLAYSRINQETNLWIEYYNVMTLNEEIALQSLNTEIEKLNYDSIMAKAKVGLVNPETEASARISYQRQKNNYQRAMYNYILAVEQFNDKLQ